MRVVPYTPDHADEMRAVCLATASERARTDETHARFTLLMYCEPYLEHGTCFMLLDDEGVARGYTLCAEDFAAWNKVFAPYREEIEALSPEYAARVANEYEAFARTADEYPAHLHIDIEEAYTGGGNGRALMETLLAYLRTTDVPGIAFGVAPGNERAIKFYERMGFEHLSAYEDDGPVFGMRFSGEAS